MNKFVILRTSCREPVMLTIEKFSEQSKHAITKRAIAGSQPQFATEMVGDALMLHSTMHPRHSVRDPQANYNTCSLHLQVNRPLCLRLLHRTPLTARTILTGMYRRTFSRMICLTIWY